MSNAMMWRCDLVPQYEAYQQEIDEAIRRVLKSGRYLLAKNGEALESEFATYIGTRHGVAVSSGTDALILALECLGLQTGDEVITTPFTAIPTYAAIRRAGGRPVFVDIEPDTFLMDVSKVAAAVTERTRAVVPVHLFGNAVDVERLRGVVGPRIGILEDCAQAHGASVRGRKVGALGDVAAFSFYPTKNLGGYGDGGMVLTDNSELAQAVRRRRMYGMINKDEFVTDGINSRLDELQAAILRVKLRHLDQMNARRAVLVEAYRRALPVPFITPQVVREGVGSVYHVYAALCRGRRDELVSSLEQAGIQTNIYYPMPLYRQAGCVQAIGETTPLPVVEDVCRRIIALPLYPEMAEANVERVAAAITRFSAEPAKDAT